MKQKLFIFLAITFLFILLVGLNALSYVQKEKIPDTEDSPNRSSYNVGATGTRAFYDLLAETGKNVKRWQEPFPDKLEFAEVPFSTFVIIGKTRKEIEQNEISDILDWVYNGGKLVVIDRYDSDNLVVTTSNWVVSSTFSEETTFMVDPASRQQMVGETNAVKPIQPTLFTAQVNAVQPSKFATSIGIKRITYEDEFDDETVEETDKTTTDGEIIESGNKQIDELFKTPTPTPLEPIQTPSIATPTTDESAEEYVFPKAPVVHLADNNANLLVDVPYGSGQIVYLSDPYIVSNGGIKLVDNAQLATNIVTSLPGVIAFDEFHQGFGRNDNRLLEYFAGTPVVPIILQILLITGLLFYSQSRRFARALPNGEQDRLSKLEYVSAMAQLQGRTKAFDLAIENIYTDFRRRVSKLFGIDNHTSTRKELSLKIAERLNRDANEIEDVMFKCEDIMHGEKTNKKEIVRLTSNLRQIEEALGLRRGKKRNS